MARAFFVSSALALVLGAASCSDSDDDDTTTDGAADARANDARVADTKPAPDARLDASQGADGSGGSGGAVDAGRDTDTSADASRDALADVRIDSAVSDVSTGPDATPALDAARADADAAARADADGAVGVDASDAGADRAVGEAGGPDAGVAADGGLDAAAEVSAIDAAQVDAATVDAAVADGGGGDACRANATCGTCLSEQCPDEIDRCSSFTGTDRALCIALRTCIRQTSCHTVNTLACYCGTADSTECLATSGPVIANGACKAQIEAAHKSTVPLTIQNQYTDVSIPGGAALFLSLCETLACAPECIPYGPICPAN